MSEGIRNEPKLSANLKSKTLLDACTARKKHFYAHREVKKHFAREALLYLAVEIISSSSSPVAEKARRARAARGGRGARRGIMKVIICRRRRAQSAGNRGEKENCRALSRPNDA